MCLGRYDPYDKQFTRERYDFEQMKKNRQAAIAAASRADTIGLVLGTLGRQGSPQVMEVELCHVLTCSLETRFPGSF